MNKPIASGTSRQAGFFAVLHEGLGRGWKVEPAVATPVVVIAVFAVGVGQEGIELVAAVGCRHDRYGTQGSAHRDGLERPHNFVEPHRRPQANFDHLIAVGNHVHVAFHRNGHEGHRCTGFAGRKVFHPGDGRSVH
jgi:hypothetical protein